MKKSITLFILFMSINAFSQDCSKIEDSLERLRCYDKGRVGSEVEKISEEKLFKERAIKTIRNSFKDPRAAIFEDMEIKESAKGVLSLCGFVNAKNSYGAYTGIRPFFYTEREWAVNRDASLSHDALKEQRTFLFNFSKYCEKSLGETLWKIDQEADNVTLTGINEDGFKFWLSCADKRVVLNAIWDKDFKQERSFKSAFMPGKSTIIKISPIDSKRFYETRWKLMKDGKTTSWKVQNRHYDFLGQMFNGIYFQMRTERGHFVQVNLDDDFRLKLSSFMASSSCGDRMFRKMF